MKTAIYYGDRISVEERAIPTIGENDVLLRNLRGGICGTDTPIVRSGSTNMGIAYGAEMGHEMVGEVVEIGEKVSSSIYKGMIAAVNPITAKRVGRRESLMCGAFSQYIVIEDAVLDYNLYEIDKNVPPEIAALVEPISVGRHGAFRSNPQKSDNIVVLGAGAVGLGAAASLMAEGIENVCVVDKDAWRLDVAKSLGAKTLNTSETSLQEGLTAIFGEADVYGQKFPNVDIFVDAAGALFLITEVMKIVKSGTKISIIAVYKTEVPTSFYQIMSKEVQIIGASGYTKEDMKSVVRNINSGRMNNIGNIVSKVYKLDNIQEAFQTAINAEKVIKVLVDLT
ncbi:Threonine dehydrogenase (modular protein) [uncultured Paludibacter sp.]|nr:Threonine dehydrogenase (modular protein) [uncultured Paludibacter sp.]